MVCGVVLGNCLYVDKNIRRANPRLDGTLANRDMESVFNKLSQTRYTDISEHWIYNCYATTICSLRGILTLDEKLAYPDIVIINGLEFRGRRNISSGKLLIPYSELPDVGIGDIVIQKSGKREINLKVLDISFLEDASNNIGTRHPHLLTLNIENSTSLSHIDKPSSNTYNIGSISSNQVQVGNNNLQISNVTIQNLVESIAKSDDEEAKSILKKLLQNSTVASLIGAGAGALLGLL